jgi:hypothetical protein
MSPMERRPGRCMICQTAGPVQRHHVARAVNLTVTVALCQPCHRRVWDHESVAGVHRRGDSDAGQAWAVLHGFLALGAVAAGEWTGDLANTRGAMLALLCSLTDETVGPNPVTVATHRTAVADGAPGGANADGGFTSEMLTAMAAAITEWLGDDELARIAVRLAATADRPDSGPRPSDVGTAQRLTTDAAELAGQLANLKDGATAEGELAQRLRDFDADTRDLLQRMTT